MPFNQVLRIDTLFQRKKYKSQNQHTSDELYSLLYFIIVFKLKQRDNMPLLMNKNNHKEKIEAKLYQPISISEHQKEKSEFSKELDKITNSTLMIGEGVTIKGNIKAENEVNIQGVVEGDIECIKINVHHSGKIVGNVKAKTMSVEGYIEGEVNAKEILGVKSSGNINGKIYYGSIKIDDGGKIEGEINYKDKQEKPEEFKDWKAL